MESKRRTQAERSRASRGALIAAARPLFGRRGFADVGTGEVVAAAGLTRGALYHQFEDKTALFVAVLESTEQEITQRVARVLATSTADDPVQLLLAGAAAWLDAGADREAADGLMAAFAHLGVPDAVRWTIVDEMVASVDEPGLVVALGR